ncbi:YidC/Oxa1 family membrane protein insertase [Streptomyces sp. DvalAA-14]|uniref:YidC/Oxa1 family membrane protein insertase n=1 Tax=unclassified Streptomyces TaxID=2593676 RepID=UPI00081B42A5|nr:MULTISPECIES: YidC/Oxa1 family membrane protein insertase [unclassified Streptomyces]MYS23979.1 membrane protein insertase YidC [Streptomyces sp. SID4948]SCE41180.1 YidC/Oxa1 family membrane protein insertase [Streptomyces sp. DvalAA-14]
MTSILAAFAHVVDGIADLLQPLFHTSAVAAAIVLLTLCVRLALHPLARAGARGQRAQSRLAPQVARLRAQHAKNPAALREELSALYAAEKVSPVTGCLPVLLQLPAFYLMYRVFSNGRIGGGPNELLSHFLLGAPLGERWTHALARGEVFGATGVVQMVLFAITAVVATTTYRRSRRQQAAIDPGTDPTAPGAAAVAGLTRLLPLTSFFTLVTIAVVPLAASLYVVTSTTWSAVEQYVLRREMSPSASAAALSDGTR